jgi:hypothetical protein
VGGSEISFCSPNIVSDHCALSDGGKDEKMSGQQIRQFFRDLFGSRLAETLEEAALRQREQYEYRLQEKERVIVDLRADLTELRAKCDRYELALVPLVSPAGDFLRGPQPPPLQPLTEPDPTSWAGIRAAHMRAEFGEEKDGVQE